MSLFPIDVKQEGYYVTVKNLSIRILEADIRRRFKSSRLLNVYDKMFSFVGTSIKMHRFFVPEFIFILSQLPPRKQYIKVINLVYANTWMSDTLKSNVEQRVDFSRINKFNFTLKPYQKEFIELYNERKQKFNLKGYILAFEQGLGKTRSSLALMEGLRKDAVVIIAPKSTLVTVWKNEIENIYGAGRKNIWVVGEVPRKADFYIVNYESIEKLALVIQALMKANNLGIIVDECHNFRSTSAKRVIRLQAVSRITKCDDILLMSGTPIKAMGSEMIPTLELIDPYFDDEAKHVFIKSFGLGTDIALDVLKNRLGIIMYRKMKSEVLNLPDKNTQEIKIKIPNANEYTLEEVKNKIIKYAHERREFHKKSMSLYEKEFNECLHHLSSKLKGNKDFYEYLRLIDVLKKKGYSWELSEEVKWLNDYEKTF